MNRLTGRYKTGLVHVPQGMMPEALDRLAAYEDTGLEPCDYNAMKAALEKCEQVKRDWNELLSYVGVLSLPRFRELAQADKEGRLAILPCKVGDTVYGCFPRYCRKAIECKVVKIRACQFSDGSIRHIVDVEFYIANPYYDDGRLMLHSHQAVVTDCYGNWDRVFLTREEAETAMERR